MPTATEPIVSAIRARHGDVPLPSKTASGPSRSSSPSPRRTRSWTTAITRWASNSRNPSRRASSTRCSRASGDRIRPRASGLRHSRRRGGAIGDAARGRSPRVDSRARSVREASASRRIACVTVESLLMSPGSSPRVGSKSCSPRKIPVRPPGRYDARPEGVRWNLNLAARRRMPSPSNGNPPGRPPVSGRRWSDCDGWGNGVGGLSSRAGRSVPRRGRSPLRRSRSRCRRSARIAGRSRAPRSRSARVRRPAGPPPAHLISVFRSSIWSSSSRTCLALSVSLSARVMAASEHVPGHEGHLRGSRVGPTAGRSAILITRLPTPFARSSICSNSPLICLIVRTRRRSLATGEPVASRRMHSRRCGGRPRRSPRRPLRPSGPARRPRSRPPRRRAGDASPPCRRARGVRNSGCGDWTEVDGHVVE